ncbi:probable aspartic protease At2g35615 [Tripterygium wilfordii]|uniref:probable aspartic protease At2g35615 n=1 Tax=Tripterygium wilfordii TaxID=458696 RepID=UPI0018F7ED44|nr:probable aspartic protease At2g35615 [Tripterygium wilfordii]
MHQLSFVLIFILSKKSIQSLAEVIDDGFSIDLIHRDSPLSPFYNQSISPSEHLGKGIVRSFNRVKYLYSSMHMEKKELSSVMIPNRVDYLMKMYIGSPPIEVFPAADTGSNLIWVRCQDGKKKHHKNAQLFNPKGSSTYVKIRYQTEFCNVLPKKERGNSDECKYNFSYGNAYTLGVLSKETFTINTTNGGSKSFTKSVFGCGNIDHGFSNRFQGIVGFGTGILSLVSQLKTEIKNKFSYCLLQRYATTNSKLKFGTGAKISEVKRVSTPFLHKNDLALYHLTLEGISVIGTRIDIHQSPGNIVIDSGTTLTMLESSIYKDIEAEVKKVIGADSVPDPTKRLNLCYEAESIEEKDLPEMIFHFSGANLHLPHTNTFERQKDVICMMIVPSNGFSVIGNVAQINFQVEYDLQEQQVSFAPADCTEF